MTKTENSNNQKPLTLNGLTRYNREVLLPAMSEVFVTKQDLKESLERLETRLSKKMNEVYNSVDKVLAKLDRFGTEHKVVSARQTRIVKVLDVFFEVLKRHGLFVPEDIQRLTRQDILTIVK